MSRERADVLLVARGLAESRARARSLILDGKVEGVSKPGQMMAADAELHLAEPDHPWVGRGGLKLVHAMDHFGLPAEGRIGLDCGASTGGFTDVLLARGATKVWAVDVGHGQLHSRLMDDERVISLENTNCRDLDRDLIADPVDAIVADLSFISLKVALPAALALAAPGCWLAALAKPQFEVGRDHVGKGGVVRDDAVRDAVPGDLSAWLEGVMGWRVAGVTDSPIRGSDGNREFLIAAWKD
ncbi:MAG: TlyA family RNA methyltransferase [Minwuia sp.]|uniref:TlyA family RNA methyltransferase n=1 Tax=Minwuia sp. TaxID=2493630 RepID=UPI003A85618F